MARQRPKEADNIADATGRLRSRDACLKWIDLNSKLYTDVELRELVDCLLARPNVVKFLCLHGNRLTDESGAKLARYLAATSTLQGLDLSGNRLGEATYLAIAAALCANTSLRYLYLYDNRAAEASRIDDAFVCALQLNPARPPPKGCAGSSWALFNPDGLYSTSADYERLRDAADKVGHPTMQSLLCFLFSRLPPRNTHQRQRHYLL